MFHHIIAIEPNSNKYSIEITYNDNLVINAEFKELLKKGNGFY